MCYAVTMAADMAHFYTTKSDFHRRWCDNYRQNGQTHIYEVTDTEVVNPYDNSIKTQGEEKELTLLPVHRRVLCVLWSDADIRRQVWMNKRYRLGEIEEAVAEMEERIDIEDDIAEIDDDFQIVVSGWSVYVESLNLTLRQGIACVWDAEEGLFMPDFDVTIVYEGNIETQEWLYYEQDGMVVTLGNWLMADCLVNR